MSFRQMPDDANLCLQLVLLSGAVEWNCKVLRSALASLLLYINRTIVPTTTTPALYTPEDLRYVAPAFIVPNPYSMGPFPRKLPPTTKAVAVHEITPTVLLGTHVF